MDKFERKQRDEKEDKSQKVEEMKPQKAENDKAKAIRESKMPEGQKQAYLKEIGAIETQSDEGKVSFAVYAKVKKIPVSLHKAMQVFPKAKDVRLATINEWEEIYKTF